MRWWWGGSSHQCLWRDRSRSWFVRRNDAWRWEEMLTPELGIEPATLRRLYRMRTARQHRWPRVCGLLRLGHLCPPRAEKEMRRDG